VAPKEKRRHNLGFLSPSNARANPIPSASTARSLGPHARRERSSEWGCNRFAPRSGAELCARIATSVAIAQKARAPAMTRASSFQRAPPVGSLCGRSVGILRTTLPQPHPRPGALWIRLTLCCFFLGRVSRQALLAKSGRLGEHIAMAFLLVADALLALPLALKQESSASCRNLGSSLGVIGHFLSLTLGRSPFVSLTPARSKAPRIAFRSAGRSARSTISSWARSCKAKNG
jgi:hypothetical protein